MVVAVKTEKLSEGRRTVFWPKGTFTLACFCPVLDSTITRDFVTLALRAAWHCLFHFERDRLSLDEWRVVAAKRLKMSDEFAYFLFTVARGLDASGDTDDVDLRLVLLALAFQSAPTEKRDAVAFVKAHLECLLLLCFIFDPPTQKVHVQTPSLQELPRLKTVNVRALRLCNVFLEGTLIEKADSAAQGFVCPLTFSELARRALAADTNHVEFAALLQLVHGALQSDMYALDEFEYKKSPSSSKATRSLTATVLPQHRKLSLRHWKHLEVLVTPVYRGANLRLFACSPDATATAFVFHLASLKTVVVCGCRDASPIVLGPVTDVLVLRNVRNCRLSAVARRVVLIDCEDVLLFLECETRPIVVGHCRRLCWAPYNVWFDGLEEELRTSRLTLGRQHWQDAVRLRTQSQTSALLAPPTTMEVEEDFTLLAPSEFYLQPTPFLCQKPFSQSFRESLGEHLVDFERRRASAKNYLNKMSGQEIELLSPLSIVDLNYLKNKTVT